MPFELGNSLKYRPLADRYWEKVEKRGPDECWPWRGATSSDGYGSFNIGRDHGGGIRGAHRVAWFLATGSWPPDGLRVLHRCDNPPCQNPQHFFLGTDADNTADKESKHRGRHPFGEHQGASKLTDAAVFEIRALYAAGDTSQQALATRFGVDQTTISDIIRGRSWKHLGSDPMSNPT